MTRAVIWMAVAIGLAGAGAYGQDSNARLTFEVASIRPAAPPDGRGGPGIISLRVMANGGPGTGDPGRWTAENFSLANLIFAAYDLKRYQYSGQGWMEDTRFDVVVKVPEGATKEQFRVMLQNFLADRFKLAIHHEKKEMQVYELVIARTGLKLKESAPEPVDATKAGAPGAGTPSAPPPPPPPPPPGVFQQASLDKEGFPILPAGILQPGRPPMTIMEMGRARTLGIRLSMEQIVTFLSNQIAKPVTDATGLKGKYDLRLLWSREATGGMAPPPPPGAPGGAPVPAASEDTGPGIFAAIQDQLGLKLEQKKGQVDVLVVDRAERVPTEN
jgi:uncharacterized protein (TIGR03435 family)